MPALTISEAAAALGFKSRSTLYRLRDNGDLDAYLTSAEPTGRRLLEMAPAGLPSLRDHIAQLVRLQANSSLGGRQPQAPPTQGRSTHPGDGDQPPNLNTEELPDYAVSRSRAEYEKANLLELERKTREGLLLRREDAEQAWGSAVNITRNRLLGVPSAAKQRIPHLELEEVELLTTLIRDALEELAAGDLKA